MPPRKRPRGGPAVAAAADGGEEDGTGRPGGSGGALDLSNHELRNPRAPMWVTPKGHVYLESFSPVYKQATDFLVAIAEPVCRPQFIHEYLITDNSLCTAASIGLTTDDVISKLQQLSKLELSEEVLRLIRSAMDKYGKVKLVLQRKRYFLDCSRSVDRIPRLLKDEVIAEALVDSRDGLTATQPEATQTAADLLLFDDLARVTGDDGFGAEDDLASSESSIEIRADRVTAVKERCQELGMPVLEEYSHRMDPESPPLAMSLRGTQRLRNYQEKALQRMFGNGRARSGIIVLPCGSGKTLVGIAAANTVKKPCLVLCTSAVSVSQWRNEFLRWSDLDGKTVSCFTSQKKDLWVAEAGSDKFLHMTRDQDARAILDKCRDCDLHLWENGAPPDDQGRVRESGILVTTFYMIGYKGNRGRESDAVMRAIRSRDWGLVLLDEVHVAPANTFRRVVDVVRSHAKLGLTATLVREDEKITDLNYIIGPKLYEANWLDLQKQGSIATVKCQDVWCPMTAMFYEEYLKATSVPKRLLLYALNPNKMRNCQMLMRYHEGRGDKIIIFSDNIFTLKTYAEQFMRRMIHGGTSEHERQEVLAKFRNDDSVRTIFLSSVGDTSIDIPEANVIIQVNSHFGARRQEAQRLGRILRPKKGSIPGVVNAWFYTLISRDTTEVFYSSKRQQFLIDQGYDFEVIDHLPMRADDDLKKDLVLDTWEDEIKHLNLVTLQSDKALEQLGQVEAPVDDEDGRAIEMSGFVRKTLRDPRDLSGAASDFYSEMGPGSAAAARGPARQPGQRNALFRNRARFLKQQRRRRQEGV